MVHGMRTGGVEVIPFSHRLRCLLPSLPLSNKSRCFVLSRLEGGRRGSAALSSDSWKATTRVCSYTVTLSSRGIDSGVPVPRATGETLRDCSADIVHASISMAPFVTGVDGDSKWVGALVCSSGGGTAL